MRQAGIIVATKVVRTALENAASMAGLPITTDATVARKAQRPDGIPDMDAMMLLRKL